MDFPPFDEISKIWAPTTEELKEFCLKNKYVRQMHGDILTEDDYKKAERSVAKIDEPGPSTSSTGELPIHTYLYTLIKKDVYYRAEDRPGNGVHFMEEEAIILSGMLERQGFLFEDVSHEPGCMVCATEKLEKELMDMMKRQLQITKLARDYYIKPENEETYNICANHRIFNPKNCIPHINGIHQHLPRPDLLSEIIRIKNEQISPTANYFNVPNFASPPDLLREDDFRVGLKCFQSRAQSFDNLTSFGAQGAQGGQPSEISRPVLPNFMIETNADQFPSISLPEPISGQTSMFNPNQGPSPTSPIYWNASALINQSSPINISPPRPNGQIVSTNYLGNNITSQISSANYIANRIGSQNLPSNYFPNNVASASANNYFANNVNGENNFVNLSVATNSQFINRQNNLNHMTQTQATRQALINNAMNNVQDQHRGRKILGKKY